MADKNNFLLNVKETYVIKIKKYNRLSICSFLQSIYFALVDTSPKASTV